jgi:hypothetical protein
MPHQVRFRKPVQEQEGRSAALATDEDGRFSYIDVSRIKVLEHVIAPRFRLYDRLSAAEGHHSIAVARLALVRQDFGRDDATHARRSADSIITCSLGRTRIAGLPLPRRRDVGMRMKSQPLEGTMEQSGLDAEAGDWIAAARRPFADYVVGSLVPVSFERYARVLHPARTVSNTSVRWETVAHWSGRTVHSLAQWEALSRPLGDLAAPPPFVYPPNTGGLRGVQLAAFCGVLAAHTASRDDCYIGVWHGYGWRFDRSDLASWFELRLDQRTFLVRRGSIETAREVGWRHADGTFVPEPPTIIWPADRAWFIASDVDLDSTYLGGSRDLIDALVADPRLEAWEVGAADPITAGSDEINGP